MRSDDEVYVKAIAGARVCAYRDGVESNPAVGMCGARWARTLLDAIASLPMLDEWLSALGIVLFDEL